MSTRRFSSGLPSNTNTAEIRQPGHSPRLFSISAETYLSLSLRDQLSLAFSTLVGVVLVVILSPVLLVAALWLLWTNLGRRRRENAGPNMHAMFTHAPSD